MKKAKVAVISIMEAKRSATALCLDGGIVRGGQSAIWIDMIGDGLYTSTSWVDQNILDSGTDITEEFLADEKSVMDLVKISPEWLQRILDSRPELGLSKEVTVALSSSPEKDLRLMAIKYLSRMTKKIHVCQDLDVSVDVVREANK